MNLEALYELRERMKNIAIAGTVLVEDDFRLKKAIENFTPISKLAPVFTQIYTLATQLLIADVKERPDILMDCLGLLDAIICTQAKTLTLDNIQELKLYEDKTSVYQNISYKRIEPLLNALTNKGSGRYEIIKNLYETDPILFTDYRVKNLLILALNDSYSEIADMIKNWLKEEKYKGMISLLKDGFQVKGGKEMERRLEIIIHHAKSQEDDFYHFLVKEGNADIKILAINGLSLNPKNQESLFALLNTEKGRVKDAVYTALAKFDTQEVKTLWSKIFSKAPTKIAKLIPFGSGSWLAEILYKEVVEALQKYNAIQENRKIEKEEKKKQKEEWIRTLSSLLSSVERAYDNRIGYLLEDLYKILPIETVNMAERVIFQQRKEGKESNLEHLVLELYTKMPSIELQNIAFILSNLHETPEQVYQRFYSILQMESKKKKEDRSKALLLNLRGYQYKNHEILLHTDFYGYAKYSFSNLYFILSEKPDIRWIDWVLQLDDTLDISYNEKREKPTILSNFIGMYPEKISEILIYTQEYVKKVIIDEQIVKNLVQMGCTDYNHIFDGFIYHVLSGGRLGYYLFYRFQNVLKELPLENGQLSSICENVAISISKKDSKWSQLFFKVSNQLKEGIAKEEIEWNF